MGDTTLHLDDRRLVPMVHSDLALLWIQEATNARRLRSTETLDGSHY